MVAENPLQTCSAAQLRHHFDLWKTRPSSILFYHFIPLDTALQFTWLNKILYFCAYTHLATHRVNELRRLTTAREQGTVWLQPGLQSACKRCRLYIYPSCLHYGPVWPAPTTKPLSMVGFLNQMDVGPGRLSGAVLSPFSSALGRYCILMSRSTMAAGICSFGRSGGCWLLHLRLNIF